MRGLGSFLYDPKISAGALGLSLWIAQLNSGCFHALRFRQEMHMRVPVILASLFLVTCPPSAKSLDAEAVNNAQFGASSASKKAINPLLIKAEILLARAHFSPGEISGRAGENLNRAIAAFAEAQGKTANKLDQELWNKLVSTSAAPVVVDYTISEADVRGPFVSQIWV